MQKKVRERDHHGQLNLLIGAQGSADYIEQLNFDDKYGMLLSAVYYKDGQKVTETNARKLYLTSFTEAYDVAGNPLFTGDTVTSGTDEEGLPLYTQVWQSPQGTLEPIFGQDVLELNLQKVNNSLRPGSSMSNMLSKQTSEFDLHNVGLEGKLVITDYTERWHSVEGYTIPETLLLNVNVQMATINITEEEAVSIVEYILDKYQYLDLRYLTTLIHFKIDSELQQVPVTLDKLYWALNEVALPLPYEKYYEEDVVK